MYMCEFCHDTTPIGHWKADWGRVCPNYSDINAIMRTHRPVLQFSMRELYTLPQLNEITYKDMVTRIDPNFLRQGIRAQALRGVKFKQFDGDTMVFDVTSSEIDLNGINYLNLVKFLSWDDFGGDPDMTPRKKALRLLWESDIQVHCDDPSFLYWGYQYILSQLNPSGSIYQEPRPPVVNNPSQRGIVCKHLNRVLRSLPFYNGDIAKAVTDQWGGKIDKRETDAIRRRADLTRQANAIPADQLQPEPEPEVNPPIAQTGIPPDLNGGDESDDNPIETF
jgi:hypothetical protein